MTATQARILDVQRKLDAFKQALTETHNKHREEGPKHDSTNKRR